jgi:hypothetical protein
MPFLNQLESKLGRYAIRNLMFPIALGQGLVLLWSLSQPNALQLFTFVPGLALEGQYWRFASWLLLPPPGNAFFAFFAIYMNWWMGRALEQAWGSFQFNIFYATGVIANLLLGLLVPQASLTPFYLNLSLFFAFASLYPDLEMLIFFILPVKVKWLAWFSGAFLAFELATSGLGKALVIVVSLLNFLIYFIPEIRRKQRVQKEVTNNRALMIKSEEIISKSLAKQCKTCHAKNHEADLRLCLCPDCGDDGQFYCPEHIKNHALPKEEPLLAEKGSKK